MNPLSPQDLISTLGPWAMFLVLFAETGLLIGFFLPGDSLLFTAGLLTATTSSGLHLNLTAVLVLAAAGAVVGAQVGFIIGRRLGPLVEDRADRPRLHAAAERAREWIERYGVGKAVVLARFVPIVRTVTNPLTGAIGVPARLFLRWQVIGGVLWTTGVVLAGHFLGRAIPSVDRYLLPIIALVILISLTPILVELRRTRASSSA
jgi:membrane-associated protein